MAGGTFFALNTALRGLMAQQKALQTTAHNVANASTEGYTRQRVVMAATFAYPVPSMSRPGGQGWQVGTGVEVQEVRRMRDEFLDSQIRYETHTLGAWEVRRDFLQEMEEVFAEPSDTGLSTLMSDFWAAWQELAKNPESSPVRTTVVETSISLAEALRHTYQQLETIREDINQMMEIKVVEVNSLARQIADLNKQIKAIKLAGDQPNDLMDQRDKLLDELAKIVDFKVEPETVTVNGEEVDTGAIKVLLADSTGKYAINLVEVNSNNELVLELEASRGTSGTEDTQILWKVNDTSIATGVNSGDPVNVQNGTLKGLQIMRDELDKFTADLNKLAQTLASKINEIHKQGLDLNGNSVSGTDYENFFVSLDGPEITAANIDVNTYIRQDVSRLAAAQSASPGDGSNALAIAQLQNTVIEELGATFDNYYKNFTARLGVAANEADRMATNQQSLVDQLTNRKESISGVSIDEEMTYMLQFQHAYEAAARVMTTLDEMLDTLINRMAVH